MPQLLQFGCPACASLLRIPLSASGQSGPCPHCHQPIVAPNPHTGAQAYRLPIAISQPPVAPDPIREVSRLARLIAPAAAPPEPPPKPEPQPAPNPVPVLQPEQPGTPFFLTPTAPSTPVQPPTYARIPATAPISTPVVPTPCSPLTRQIPLPTAILIGLLAALLALAAGYQIRNGKPSPAITQPAPSPAAPASLPPPASVIQSAREALDQFLAANYWKDRISHILDGERLAPEIEAYHATHPDGPTLAREITVEHCEAGDSDNALLVVFRIRTADSPQGFNAAVLETPQGWKVDWRPFVEFRDKLFDQFVSGKGPDRGTFHLIVKRSSKDPINAAVSYDLIDPATGKTHPAHIMGQTPAGMSLRNAISQADKNGLPFITPVLELTRPTAANATSLEITNLIAPDWRPSVR